MSGPESESEKSSRRNSEPKHDASQVGRILGRIGWSRQKPDHRSDKREEEAIEDWKNQEWPRIKKTRIKKAETNDRTVMFVDEAGSTRLGFINFLPRFGPGLPAEKRQCSGLRSTMTTSLPSVASPRQASFTCAYLSSRSAERK